jgi:hypothetical protein
MTALPKLPPVVSAAIRELPKRHDLPCTLNLFGCREMPEYTILAHLRGKWGLGLAQKPHDFFAIYACDRCHDCLDHRSRHAPEPEAWEILHALYRSQELMVLHGALQAK